MYKLNKVKWKGKGSYNHNSHYGVKISLNYVETIVVY